MKHSVYRSVFLMVSFVLITGVSVGSPAVVLPLSVFERVQTDHHHGVLLGTNHVVMSFSRNGQGHAHDFNHSKEMEWQIEEVTHGKRSLTVQVPIDGPFSVKLPVGSYRVTTMRFRSPEGTWHGVLPTVFEIRPWECTSLGTSMFQIQMGFVTGWISRHVLHEEEFSRANHDQLIGGNKCSISRATIRDSVKHPVRLDRSEAQQ